MSATSRPSWSFPSLERDLFIVGSALAAVVLTCGAALGVIVDRLLHRDG